MGLGTGMASAMLNGADDYAVWLSLNTGDPGTTGASEVSGMTRVATTWSVLNRVMTGTAQLLTVPAAGSPRTVTHWSAWTLASGGTFGCGGALDEPETYSTNGGTYALVPVVNIP